jgi:hypothetical protein
MSSLNNLFGFLASIMSLTFTLTPMITMIEGLKAKQIKNISIIYLKVQCVMFTCWFLLGVNLSDKSLSVTNGLGVIIDITMIGMYYYIYNMYKEIFIYSGVLIIINPIFYVLFNATVLEVIAGLLNLAVIGSMYIKIREALATKDGGFVNIPFLLGGFCCALTWEVYGLMNGYVAVIICNAIMLLTILVNTFVYFWDVGYFDDKNIVIASLKMILRVDDNQDKTVSQKTKMIDF